MAGEREPVGRAIDLLVWLATHPTPPWSVRAVARELDTSPATVHRLFGVFESRNLLERDGNGGYLPGLELFRLSHAVAGQMSPVRLVRPHLETLSHAFSETVMLGAYNAARAQMMYIDVVQAPHPVRYMLDVNTWMALHAGATGLAIVAFLPESERRSIYARGLPSLTDRTLTTEPDLEAICADVRGLGYASTRGQRTVGAVGTAAPVFDAAGEVFGDVCMTIPEQRFDEKRTTAIGSAVAATAALVSAELSRAGYRRSNS